MKPNYSGDFWGYRHEWVNPFAPRVHSQSGNLDNYSSKRSIFEYSNLTELSQIFLKMLLCYQNS